MEMTDRERIISGLKCCAKAKCEICPYEELCFGEEICTCSPMAKDAYELIKAQEPVKPVFERQFMSNIELYDCGKCGTSLGAKGIANYCMYCGTAVKWE